MIKRLTFLAQLLCLLFLFNHRLQAQLQVPQVESRMHFAGMDLHVSEQARRDIQSSVDALYRSEKHFNLMLERVDMYMPIIEPILLELGVPAEFKYLVIQESALVPDAVSSSNAVGYWQFKESSATELGLRIDRQVDERMNIISSTEGAARYLLRSNAEFDNWLFSLQSYMVGQGGTSRSVDKKLYGARQMKIDANTHWYVKKFLSHLVAFENAVGKQSGTTILYQYTSTQNKSLKQIAYEFDTEEEQLIAYNKWLKSARIPDDKNYTVIVPLSIGNSEELLADAHEKNRRNNDKQQEQQVLSPKQPQAERQVPGPGDKLLVIEMNNLKGVVARQGDQLSTLAEIGGLSESRFRKFNDLGPRQQIEAGQFYYLQKKHRRARVYEHVLQPGESLWQVAQRYGIRLDKLQKKNRMSHHEQARPGRVLWLRFMRPRNQEVEYRPVKEPKEPLYASTRQKPEAAPQAITPVTESVPATSPTPALVPAPSPVPATATAAPAGPQTAGNSQADTLTARLNIQETSIQDTRLINPEPADDTLPSYLNKKIVHPADSPVNKAVFPQEMPVRTQEVQKDTINSQNNSRDISDEIEEKSLFPQESSPEPKDNGDDSFFAEAPVNFIEAEEKAPQKENIPVHEVQAGETLYALSRKYGLSVQQLIEWNQLPAQPVISIGQQLRLAPANKEQKGSSASHEASGQQTENSSQMQEQEQDALEANTKTSFRYHEVSAGESMYRVARMYNVTIKDIMQWNDKENFDIREGEKLIVGREGN